MVGHGWTVSWYVLMFGRLRRGLQGGGHVFGFKMRDGSILMGPLERQGEIPCRELVILDDIGLFW